ncbi:hypothetical protein [Pedobacter nutrimenti]|uniref:hypothetical protein n=1 Tax=Pedobacter nutrimenti TaxID=1241337 RepID=UPI00292EC4AB|nr:hypothetical protein [Pedobacter nutrimenti]
MLNGKTCVTGFGWVDLSMSKKDVKKSKSIKFKLPRKLKKAQTKARLKQASEYLWAELAKGFEQKG